MRFAFTDEQEQFRLALRRFLEDKSPTTEVRRLMETEDGRDPEVWKQLSGELGLTAIHIPEEYGGQGFGIVELGIAMEEMGRALLCAPYFASTVMAATAILNTGTEDQKRALLPAIAAGETVATLALAEESGQWTADAVAATAMPSNGNFRIDGTKGFVLDGRIADQIIVAARTPGSRGEDGVSLFLVEADAEGLTRTPLETLDPTRKLARLEFDSVPAELLGETGAATGPIERTLEIAAIALANEMVGGAEKLRESAMDYAAMRMQFGRPIASFQVTKHKAADMLVDIELAKSAAYYAAEAADENDPDLPALASLAKARASEAYMQMAIHAVQIHGGIGFTWDNDTHLWFKRAKSSEVFLGDPAYHRALMMQHWNV